MKGRFGDAYGLQTEFLPRTSLTPVPSRDDGGGNPIEPRPDALHFVSVTIAGILSPEPCGRVSMTKRFCFLIWVVVLVLPGSDLCGQNTNCALPPAGMLSWWRAEGNGLDNEGIHHGTVMGGGGFAPAKVGRGFVFSGSGDDYLNLPPNLFPMPTSGSGNTPFSFELWFQTASGGVILGQQDQRPFDPVAANVPAIYVGTNGHLHVLMFWGVESLLQSSNSVADGLFHHVAVTYDGNTEILYLDGTAIDSLSFTQESYAGIYFYQLGTGWTDGWPSTPGGWWPFTGTVDEPALYMRALSGAEVASLYQAGSAGKCGPPPGRALVHRYSFNEPAGSEVAIDSISASHGQLVFANPDPPYTNGFPDGSDFTGTGRLALRGTNGYVSLPPRLSSWFSNATFEAWVTWNGPSTSVWQRVWDFGFNDLGTNRSGIGTNYIIFSPSRGGTELMGFEETTVNPFGTDIDPNSLILYGQGKMPLGQLTYIAVTYDPLTNSSKLYVNGLLVSTASKPLNPLRNFTDYNNWLGRSQWTRDPFYNGEYEEFRIWDGVLTGEEIAAHHAAGPNEQFVRVHPRLFCGRSGSDFVLSWYTNYATEFKLQSASSPGAATWVNETNPVVVTNGTYQVRLPFTATEKFYRLKR